MHDLPPESMIKNWVKIPADSHSKCALIDRIKLNSDILPSWHLISTGYYLLDIWMIHIKNRKKHQPLLQLLSALSICAKWQLCFCFLGCFFFLHNLQISCFETHMDMPLDDNTYWTGKKIARNDIIKLTSDYS